MAAARRPVGLTRDAGWQVGVSRTIAADVETVWALLTSPTGLAVWLGPGATLGDSPGSPYATHDGLRGELRSLRPLDRIRLTWQREDMDHDTTVQVAIAPAGGDRCVVRWHQERMHSAHERESQRVHWRGVMARVEELLAS